VGQDEVKSRGEGKLYAVTGWGNNNNSARLYRTENGISWNPVISNGFGNTDNSAISVLVEYDNWLYAAIGNSTDGFEIWQMLQQVYLPVVAKP
jgi:hypothetical protein